MSRSGEFQRAWSAVHSAATGTVQVIVYGLPAFPPSPEEEDRVVFAGCMMPAYEEPKWHCPTCEVSYTGRGEVVEESNEVW